MKNTQLSPAIVYKTPDGHHLVLEPSAGYCKNVGADVISKFSAVKFDHRVFINVNDDLTDLLPTGGGANSTIVYKLKVNLIVHGR